MSFIRQEIPRKIAAIREEYVNQRTVFIAGQDMEQIVRFFGATSDDLERLKEVSDHLVPDPTLPFRESRNGRFCFDFAANKLRRTKFQPFVLTAEEDFVRHDSGMIRKFRGIQDDLQLNRAFQALMLFKACMFKGVEIVKRPKFDYNTDKWVSTVFNLRTITSKDLLGEPALEGVHSDGVDHTMTTFLGSENMRDDSAKSFIHDMKQANAVRWDQTNPEYLQKTVQHKNFLDTLLIVDHERKHSLSPVFLKDEHKRGTRDMLIFFTRKPVTKGHVSFVCDSLEPHEEIPFEIDLDDVLKEQGHRSA